MGRTEGGARFSASPGSPSRGGGGHGLRVCGAGCALSLPSGPRAATEAGGGAGWPPAPRRSPSAAGGMVRPAGRARLPRFGRSARAGAQRAGERARLAGPGPGRAVGERAPPGGAGAAAEPSGRRDHVGPGAQSSRGDVPRGQVLRGGRHRPAGTAPPPPAGRQPSASPTRTRSRHGRAPGRKTSGPRRPAGLAARRPGHLAPSRPVAGGDGGRGMRDPARLRPATWGGGGVWGTFGRDLGRVPGGGLPDLLEGTQGTCGRGQLAEGGDVGVVSATRGRGLEGRWSSGPASRGSLRGGTEIGVALCWDRQRGRPPGRGLREGVEGLLCDPRGGRAWGAGPGPSVGCHRPPPGGGPASRRGGESEPLGQMRTGSALLAAPPSVWAPGGDKVRGWSSTRNRVRAAGGAVNRPRLRPRPRAPSRPSRSSIFLTGFGGHGTPGSAVPGSTEQALPQGVVRF